MLLLVVSGVLLLMAPPTETGGGNVLQGHALRLEEDGAFACSGDGDAPATTAFSSMARAQSNRPCRAAWMRSPHSDIDPTTSSATTATQRSMTSGPISHRPAFVDPTAHSSARSPTTEAGNSGAVAGVAVTITSAPSTAAAAVGARNAGMPASCARWTRAAAASGLLACTRTEASVGSSSRNISRWYHA